MRTGRAPWKRNVGTLGLPRAFSEAPDRGGATIGDVLEVQTGGESIRGTLVPRYEHDDDKHIVIKLKNGYNVGISVEKISKVVRVAKGEAPKFVTAEKVASKGLPEVSILGTGGTIASRVDYRTGAVSPATTAEELYSLFPELSEIASNHPGDSPERLQREPGAEALGDHREEGLRGRGEGGVGDNPDHGDGHHGLHRAALSFALERSACPALHRGLAALLRQALVRRVPQPDRRRDDGRPGGLLRGVRRHARRLQRREARSPFGDEGEEEPHEREGRLRVDGRRARWLLVQAGDPGDGSRGAAPAGRREGLRGEAQLRPRVGAREVLPVDARRVPRRAPGVRPPRGRLRGDRAGAHQQQEHRSR